MSSNFNDTTPAAPGANTNVKWQTDGAGNDSAYVGVGLPVAVGVFVPGVGANAQVCAYLALTVGVKFPAGAAGSYANAKTAATASTVYTFSKNGSAFATATFAISGVIATWTQASDATFAAGDILELDGPATADASLANIGFTLAGVRT